ncbi:MAG: SpoIVB peptidase [Clostridia bacterium]|nr:SpoIVB peptidase [Clostridia bacterium]
MKKIKFILTVFFMFIIYIYVSYISLIPNNIFLLNNEELKLRKLPGIEVVETLMTNNSNLENTINEFRTKSLNNQDINDNVSSTNIELKLFGKILIKNINVTKIDEMRIVPVGKVIGAKMYTNGVLIVGMSEIEDKYDYIQKPYENSNIKPGDTILKINEQRIEDINNLKQVVNDSNGKELTLTLLRNGNILDTSIIPVEISDKKYQLGLWVKDAATGVGTMTFYEPESKCFGILGHGITDTDTSNLINIDYGELVTAKIVSLKRGTPNLPGEIKGTIINSQTIGQITKNTQFGVYGILNNLTALNIDVSKSIEIASRDEITESDAKILCSVESSNTSKEYDIKIEKIYKENDYNNKSMLIRIVDEELLKQTGGIIRGLSGAPIIQNGKFVGAITNVLVSNPEVGYAIFADMMIKELKHLD